MEFPLLLPLLFVSWLKMRLSALLILAVSAWIGLAYSIR